MKHAISRSALGLAVWVLSALGAPAANAAERVLRCTLFGHPDGTARITILAVEDHPEMKVFKLKLRFRATQSDGQVGFAELAGALAAQISPQGSVYATGVALTQPGSEIVVNSETLTLQGNVKPDGTYLLSLYDVERVLQHGFGAPLDCSSAAPKN